MTRHLLLAALVLVVAAACGKSSTDVDDGGETVSLDVQVDLSSFPIDQVSVEVAGPGISTPLAFNLTLTEGSASGTIKVPAGSDRVLTVTAFDAAGIATHRGSATISVEEGENPSAVNCPGFIGDYLR